MGLGDRAGERKPEADSELQLVPPLSSQVYINPLARLISALLRSRWRSELNEQVTVSFTAMIL